MIQELRAFIEAVDVYLPPDNFVLMGFFIISLITQFLGLLLPMPELSIFHAVILFWVYIGLGCVYVALNNWYTPYEPILPLDNGAELGINTDTGAFTVKTSFVQSLFNDYFDLDYQEQAEQYPYGTPFISILFFKDAKLEIENTELLSYINDKENTEELKRDIIENSPEEHHPWIIGLFSADNF